MTQFTPAATRRFAAICAFAAAAAVAAPLHAQAPLSASAGTVWNAAQVSVQPALLNERQVSRRVSHRYPAHLLDAGLAGHATLQLVLSPEGKVEQVEGVASTDAAVADVARSYASVMRFSPARVDGVAVRCRVTVPVDFAPAAG